MNYSIEQSEITMRTEEQKKFSALVDLYSNGLSREDMLLSEISRFECIDWEKENIFNQLIAFSVLASAYCALKSKKLDYSKAYYTDQKTNYLRIQSGSQNL